MSDDFNYRRCDVCGEGQAWVECWLCDGEGETQGLGSLDNPECLECNGDGGRWKCQGQPHTAEQVTAYWERLKGAGA